MTKTQIFLQNFCHGQICCPKTLESRKKPAENKQTAKAVCYLERYSYSTVYSKISTEGTGKADCVPIQALLKAMNSNFCDVGNKIYHIIVVLSNSGVYWESDEEYEKLRELLVNQWCASNRAQKILILFTPNKTPWDEIGLELDNTIRVDTDYTFYNELTIKTLKKWIARVIGYVVDW